MTCPEVGEWASDVLAPLSGLLIWLIAYAVIVIGLVVVGLRKRK